MTYLLLAAAAIAAAQPGPAADPEPDDDAVVVTGTRSSEPVDVGRSGSAITVIDDEALRQRQVRAVADVLRDVPGIAVSQVPGQTQVRLRGSEANHVLVLVDGIEVADPFQGEFDFGTLPADEGARIEVLRGQQSALYGSDAIGGVIQYLTLSGREAPGYTARVEGGSFGTVNAAARAAGVAGDVDYALTGTLNTTDGTPNARGGTRNLASDTGAVSLKSTWTPAANATLTGVVRYSNQYAEFNGSDFDPTSPTFGLIVDTPGSHSRSEALYALVGAQVALLGGRWTHSLTGQIADVTRDTYTSFGRDSGDKGGRLKGSYATTLLLGEPSFRHAITFAVDGERERYCNTDPSGFAFTGARHTTNVGIVGQYELTLGERAGLGASVRRDLNNRFADTTTYRVQGSYRLGGGTRLRAAAGSGVKNPGFYELYGFVDGRFIGNAGLKPERSEGWEVGAEQRLAGGRVTLGADYFQSVLHDEIVTTFPAPDFVATPANSDAVSRQKGAEAYLNARLGEAWRVDAAYTYLHAREAGASEVRRPAHVGSVAVSWRAPQDRGGLTAVVRYNGRTNDLAFTDPSFVPVRAQLGAFTLVSLNGDLALSRRLALFGRIENVLGEHYEQVFSFTNPGRAAYAGVRARF